MSASNRILIILDLIKGVIAVVCGNLALPSLVRYLIGSIQPAFQISISLDKSIIIILFLLITIFSYHKTDNKIVRALVVIFLFVPVILMLLSFFSVLSVPLPF